ncbi:MAG: EB domain-containing protein [Pseudomonadota bacterium]
MLTHARLPLTQLTLCASLLGLGLALSACPEDCPAGDKECACLDGNACNGDLVCRDGQCNEPGSGCTAGSENCACEGGESCQAGLVCDATVARCVRPTCAEGTDGCACTEDGRCGMSSLGEALECVDAVCVAPSCPAGTTGCACQGGADCTAEADRCSNGFCAPGSCLAGEAGCACFSGDCLAGLTCVRDRCVDNRGYPGGACLADGTCHHGFQCTGAVCARCQLGGVGCGCDSLGACDRGAHCVDDLCLASGSTGPVPANPICYTPCNSDLVTEDGSFRDCPADGLMVGCVGDLECIDGSCLPTGSPPAGCTEDLQCPSFQACIQGRCYSNCVLDTDCPSGSACEQHVCRTTCAIGGTSCAEGLTCVTSDGANGHCLAVATPEGEPQTAVDGDYVLSAGSLSFSNVNTSMELVLTNNSPTFETFTFRKRDHTAAMADATIQSYQDPPDDGVDCNPAQDCPLVWLEMGESGATARVQSFSIGVEGNGGTVSVAFADAGGSVAVRWNGRIEVRNRHLPTKTLHMDYSERPEGRWAGDIHYFAQFGTNNLDDWRLSQASRDSSLALERVGNALIKRWGAFRSGNLSWDEFMAVLSATKQGSWNWPSVKRDCPVDPAGACYLYASGSSGLQPYSNDLLSNPIPTGVVELPFAVNLHLHNPGLNPGLMRGRIESNLALQYAGNPAFTLDFGSDPATCERTTADGTCLVFIDNVDGGGAPIPLASIFVGGRYIADSSGCSQNGYAGKMEPWLVPGFARATQLDPDDQIRKRYECRDSLLPFDDGSATLPIELQAKNKSLAASNPIPDGRTRKRSIHVVDGALINQSKLFILFEERFESFLPDDNGSFSAFGYMVLQRSAADLDPVDGNANSIPDVYEGSVPEETRTDQSGKLDVVCSPDLLHQALDYSSANNTVTSANVFKLVNTLISGISVDTTAEPLIDPDPDEAVHYLCVDTGMFNGGQHDKPDPTLTIPDNDFCTSADANANHFDDNGSCDDGGEGSDTAICPFGTDLTDCGERTAGQINVRVACPAESEVVFFTVDPAELSPADIANQACQVPAAGSDKGTCTRAMIATWQSHGKAVQIAPFWQCTDRTQQYCDRDRYDLRAGKRFFKASSGTARPVFNSLYADISSAFRYKVRFRSRTGKTIGFAPQLCVPGSDQIPYCYDPPTVESIRERVDCLLAVWRDFHDDDALLQTVVLDPGDLSAVPPVPPTIVSGREMVDEFLCANYANTEACHPEMDQTQQHDGFERLFAELLVMMGDESYTQSFASRFDLAGTNASSFQGAAFEAGGINLSGPAGFEMYSLYQAAQYYQEALDRFYSMSPLIWRSLAYGFASRNFVSQATVTMYFERLIRASTQKARTWSQVAQRYQNFNRPDLARSVIERAYTATYLESIVLGQLMQRITAVLKPEDKPQVAIELENGQRRYRMALLDMRSVYTSITDNINFFGLPPDYIPFPTLGLYDQTAFEVILPRAKEKLAIAADRENDALNRSAAFETDSEEFQAELVRLRANYEGQLGEVCGTFQGDDGRIYPAVSVYADKSAPTRRVGDPCGTVNNGAISQAMGQFENFLVDLQRVRTNFDNVLAAIEIERSRVSAQCGLILDIAEFEYDQGTHRANLAAGVSAAHAAITQLDRITNWAGVTVSLAKCFAIVGTANGTDCGTGLASAAAFNIITLGCGIGILALEAGIATMEQFMARNELSTARWVTERQCDAALIDSNATMANLVLSLKEIELSALQAQYQVELASSELLRLSNLAKRLEQELTEEEQFAINIQAARNDPNVRIYRNDAFINADLSFKDAMQEAYRTTKVFEYYTSQSYADLEKLFLIRMVQYGDYNLANYVADLENAFNLFEEDYGLADTRVTVMSLRDDIMNIPRLDDGGLALSEEDRIQMMRDRLADPSMLDENGYLTVPFSTNFSRLSPLTRNHKLYYIEAEVIGSETGDDVGRIYLRQQGTSAVRSVGGDKLYFRFPERLAVINPFFNGERPYDYLVYGNYRLRDRPYVNTSWELVINQRDELENQDINLQSLNDVRLFVYYTDFTQF